MPEPIDQTNIGFTPASEVAKIVELHLEQSVLDAAGQTFADDMPFVQGMPAYTTDRQIKGSDGPGGTATKYDVRVRLSIDGETLHALSPQSNSRPASSGFPTDRVSRGTRKYVWVDDQATAVVLQIEGLAGPLASSTNERMRLSVSNSVGGEWRLKLEHNGVICYEGHIRFTAFGAWQSHPS